MDEGQYTSMRKELNKEIIANCSYLVEVLYPILPEKKAVLQSIKILAYAILGGFIISPLVERLPILGWDWYYFFNSYDPVFNINSLYSAYPPFACYFINLLTWSDWRSTIAIMWGITLVTLALAAWLPQKQFLAIPLALINPPVFYLMWVGHPDVLMLLGSITGIIPLALVKPQIVFWGLLRDKKLVFWTGVFIIVSLIIWPLWPLNFSRAGFTGRGAFGWAVLGWPLAVIGVVLLLGAGNNLYRLMAAGSFITPYLSAYHLVVLTPAVGGIKGYRQILMWFSSWFLILSLGLGENYRYLGYLFPLSVYWLSFSWGEYKANVLNLVDGFSRLAIFNKVPRVGK